MNDLSLIQKILLYASLLLFLVGFIVMFYRMYLMKKLSDDILAGDMEDFERRSQAKISILVLRPYNLAYLRLNAAIMKNDPNLVKQIVNACGKLKMTLPQREALYEKVFYYALREGETGLAKKAYRKLSDIEEYSGRKQIDRIYDTFIEKGYRYLEETEREYQTAKDGQKLEYEMLLMNMYMNAGNKERSRYYEELSSRRMSEGMQQKTGMQSGCDTDSRA